jgi:hypothetical protein
VLFGRESARSTDFNSVNWGDAANGYLLLIKRNLSDGGKFNHIIDKAMHIAKADQKKDSMVATAYDQDANERGLLGDDSESDPESSIDD